MYLYEEHIRLQQNALVIKFARDDKRIFVKTNKNHSFKIFDNLKQSLYLFMLDLRVVLYLS